MIRFSSAWSLQGYCSVQIAIELFSCSWESPKYARLAKENQLFESRMMYSARIQFINHNTYHTKKWMNETMRFFVRMVTWELHGWYNWFVWKFVPPSQSTTSNRILKRLCANRYQFWTIETGLFTSSFHSHDFTAYKFQQYWNNTLNGNGLAHISAITKLLYRSAARRSSFSRKKAIAFAMYRYPQQLLQGPSKILLHNKSNKSFECVAMLLSSLLPLPDPSLTRQLN